MELKYIILTIIKILISVPAIVLVAPLFAEGAALMGGHLDNKSNTTSLLNLTSSYFNFDLGNDQELSTNDSAEKSTKLNPKNDTSQLPEQEESEEIPDPSALVVPGYNLPENIFNKGKPFYLEKDPLTGAVDFENRAPDLKVYDDDYDYASEDDSGSDLYAKANIERKDGGLSGHKSSDVNQLTPNLYDFLNLPLKYNSDKYVYPLISSSYANTKVQGNVNKHHNHNKEYSVTTYKPIKTPTYFPIKSAYFNKETKATTEKMVTTTTTSTTPRTTTAQIYLTNTAKEANLMDNAMNHPSFTEPQHSTQKVEDIYLTTGKYQSSPPPSTQRIMSLFEQFIAGFDEPVTTTQKSKPTPNVMDVAEEEEEETVYNLNGHASPQQNILTGTNMGQQGAYDYDYEEEVTDNIAVENQPASKIHVVTSAPPPQDGSNQKRPPDTKSADVVSPLGNPNLDDPEEDFTTPETSSTTPKVTSLPLGENHVAYNNPIIVATQNLREQLNHEKVAPKPFGKPLFQPVSGTSNIHIAPDQDTVSFVVGNHQNVEGQYIGTALKESPYDTNPFRPLYAENSANNNQNTVSYTIQTSQEVYKPPKNHDNVKMQPIRNSEASLAIGVPLNLVKGKPGQVVDGSSEINNEKIEFPKGNGPKIVFPDEKTAYDPSPPPSKNFLHPPNKQFSPQPTREILKLNSQPMFHQLPSDLTPPDEPNSHPNMNRDRPPWDPRPGHFHSGRPEYARPPRPPPNPNDAFKRIDSLPNILPQFRPNAKPHIHKGYMRQPLLDRPSNRPIGFFEKLHPPPPPPPKLLQNLRKEQEQSFRPEERIVTDGYKKSDQFMFYQGPPKMVLASRRNGGGEENPAEVETLQMLQAKQDKKDRTKIEMTSSFQANLNGKDSIEKPIYVVYPVNTPPLKLDAIDTNKKEPVVIGTRAELPLPPSKIQPEPSEEEGNFANQFGLNREIPKHPPSEFDFHQNDRHDSPILKPHHHFPPIKSEFPYPLERPDPPPLLLLNSAPVETASNDLENQKFSSNQWNSLDDTESRIVTGSKINTQSNQISVKLKTYTEKPIAVAYTPTEAQKTEYNDRYSMPNYAGPVIPEIRPGNSAFVLSTKHKAQEKIEDALNGETTHVPQLDFQAPFQASLNVDNVSHGWSVIKDKPKEDEVKDETTTSMMSSTSEFDIENFKPQLIGGFKPIYNFPEGETQKGMEVKERQE